LNVEDKNAARIISTRITVGYPIDPYDLASAILKFRPSKKQAENVEFCRDFPIVFIKNRCFYTFENDAVVFGNILIACGPAAGAGYANGSPQ